MNITEKIDKKTETIEVIVKLPIRKRSTSPIIYYTTKELEERLRSSHMIDKLLHSDVDIIANTRLRGYQQEGKWIFKLRPPTEKHPPPPAQKKIRKKTTPTTTNSKKGSTSGSIRDRMNKINK